MKEKIGIGFIGEPKNKTLYSEYNFYYEPVEKCTTWTKNKLLYQMINDECKHIFLLDEAVEILDNNIFNKYIEAAEKSGIKYLVYSGNYKIKNSIDYDGIGISFAEKVNKQFCYYHWNIFEEVGFFDGRYLQGILDQIDYTYRVCQKEFCAPWGWFADYEDSNKYIKQIQEPVDPEIYAQLYWNENQWFKYKHKEFYNKLSDTNHEIVIKKLEELKEQYGKNI